jgi:spore cortex formation protein SpoVR/YcgB (stage V sporulation)
MENSLENYNEEENILTKYIKQIDELREANKKEELEKLLNSVVNILPENVKSLSIPVTSSNGEIEFITKERESNVPKEEQKDWNISDLIAYSVREEGLTDKDED